MPKTFYYALMISGMLLVAFFGLMTFAAISDAQFRCPGIQCSDAKTSAIFGGSLVAVGLLMSAAGIRGIRRNQ